MQYFLSLCLDCIEMPAFQVKLHIIRSYSILLCLCNYLSLLDFTNRCNLTDKIPMISLVGHVFHF